MENDHSQPTLLIEENRQLRQRVKQLETLLNQITGQTDGEFSTDSSTTNLLNALPVGIYIYQNDRICYANRTAFHFAGLDPETADPNRVLSFIPPEYRRTIAQVAKARMEGLEVDDPYPVKLVKETGETVWMLIEGQIIKYRGAPANLGVSVDFTAQKHAGDLLEASQANLEAILENTDDYILLSDREGYPVYFNSAYARIMKEVLGIDVKPGVKPHSFLPDDAARQVWDGYHRRVLSGERFSIEYSIRDATGKDRHLEVAYYPIVDQDEVTGFCEFTHEVTEAKRAREELEKTRQEQAEQLRRVAGGIAHEVHNSLFPLSASVYMIRQFLKELKHEKSNYFLGLVETMEKSLSRSIDLTDSVMGLSKLEDFASESTELNRVLSEVLTRHRERIDQIQAEVDIDIPTSLMVRCPALYLSQVLGNLVNNALDALQEAPVRKLSVKATEGPDDITLSLSDTGSGINPKDRDEIFDPFFSTKSGEGTGIGLSIVKRIIDLCGGRISVESVPGSGTTMIVAFPRGEAT